MSFDPAAFNLAKKQAKELQDPAALKKKRERAGG